MHVLPIRNDRHLVLLIFVDFDKKLTYNATEVYLIRKSFADSVYFHYITNTTWIRIQRRNTNVLLYDKFWL